MTENSVRQRKYCSSNFLFAEALSLELAAFASAGELRLLLLYLIFGLTLHQFMSESFAPKFLTCCHMVNMIKIRILVLNFPLQLNCLGLSQDWVKASVRISGQAESLSR